MRNYLPESNAGSSWLTPELRASGLTRLPVKVLCTEEAETERALRYAGQLMSGLGTGIELIATHVVPYALPLRGPDTSLKFRERKLAAMVEGMEPRVTVSLYVCRDPMAVWNYLLPGQCVAITGQRRLARLLLGRGHVVILAPSEGGESLAGRILHAVSDAAVRRLLGVRQSLRQVVR